MTAGEPFMLKQKAERALRSLSPLITAFVVAMHNVVGPVIVRGGAVILVYKLICIPHARLHSLI